MSVEHPAPIRWPTRSAALGWFAGGTLLGFVIPWAGTDLMDLNRDLYYLVHFTLVLSFLAVFLARTGVPWSRLLRRRLGWSLGLGALVAVPAVLNVLRDPATPRPDGAYLGFEVLWRGVVYGAVDAALLYVFPALVALVLLRGNTAGLGRRLVFAVLTLLLAVVVVGVYHLGYEQFRGPALLAPEIGAVQFSLPTVLTTNPAGAVVAHVAAHVAAVLHQYEGPTYLPPAGEGPRLLDGAAGAVAAGVWVLLTAVVWWRGRHWLLTGTRGAAPGRAGARRP